MLKKIREFFKEKGQGVVEYALVLGVAALIAAALLANGGLGDKIVGSVNKVGDSIDTAATKISAAVGGVTISTPDGNTGT